MLRRLGITATILLTACAANRQAEQRPEVLEPFFTMIRKVSQEEASKCEPLTPIQVVFAAERADPPINPKDYRLVRRRAFNEFEQAVLKSGVSTVWMTTLRERVGGPPEFKVYEVYIGGTPVRCPE